MKKVELLILIIIFVLIIFAPMVCARGTINLNQTTFYQNSTLKITINPTEEGIYKIGTIYTESDQQVQHFIFSCLDTQCYSPVSTEVFLDESYSGTYYATVFDWYFPQQWIKTYFDVLEIIPPCENSIKDKDETDIDCGGSCNPCENQGLCLVNTDCQSNFCNNNSCETLSKDYINTKNNSKYFENQVFLISDENWKEVLKLVPLTTWKENETIIKYPSLIFHNEKESFDGDSIIHFLQLYAPSNLTIFSQTPKKFDELLISDNNIPQTTIQQSPNDYLGSGLQKNQISKISINKYLDYWRDINTFVISEDNYKIGLMASVFASHLNAPLLFEGDLDYNIINEKNVFIIGGLQNQTKISNRANIIESFTIESLQQHYINLTNSTKIIILNTNDLDIVKNKKFWPEKSKKINKIYTKMSLAAPFLAAAKNQVIININIPESPDNSECNQSSKIINNIELADNLIKTQLNSLFKKNPEYLTIIATPNAIPDSVYRKCHKTKYQYRNATDWIYGFYNNKQLKTGRIYGITISDASSYIAKSIFYEELFNPLYKNNFTGLTIGHSFERYYNNMQKQYNATTASGYDTLCFTSKQREGCTKSTKPKLEKYYKKQFIIFGDHGFPNRWAHTLNSKEIPWFDLSYIFAHACLTNNFWQSDKDLMGANILRHGAIAYHGATGVSYGDNSETIALQKLTTNDFDLGTLNKELIEELEIYKRDYMLLGDPTLKPVFKNVIWEELVESNPSTEELLTENYTFLMNISNTTYIPEEDIIITVLLTNNNSYDTIAVLEFDIFSFEDNYVSELHQKQIKINSSEQKEINFSMKVIPTMPSGQYTTIVKFKAGDTIIDEKNITFNIKNTLKMIDLTLLTCKDLTCNDKSITFNSNETIYLDYNSSVSKIEINAFIKQPDKTMIQITPPYQFHSSQKGTHTFFVNASKNNYENKNTKSLFSIIRLVNIPPCTINEDCGLPKSQLICNENKILNQTITPTCSNDNGCENLTKSSFIKTCDYDCQEGGCLPFCSKDDDCPEDYYDKNYCGLNDVFQNFHNLSCQNESCVKDINQELIERCKFGCSDNKCVEPECYDNKDCGFPSSELICQSNNITNKSVVPTCNNNNCENITKYTLIEECNYECKDGKCEQKNKKKSQSPRKSPEYKESIKNPKTSISKTSIENYRNLEPIINLGQSKKASLKISKENNLLLILITILPILILLFIFIILITLLQNKNPSKKT